jgi:hypothetical protein
MFDVTIEEVSQISDLIMVPSEPPLEGGDWKIVEDFYNYEVNGPCSGSRAFVL